jgi:GntR family transcriptional regulator
MIRAEIERGDYPPGSALPPEDALAARYGVSRPTVNQALRLLRADGLISVRRGRGTIVRPLPVITRHAIERQRIRETGGARGAFEAELRQLGMTSRSDTEVGEIPAPASAAGLLGIEPGSPVLARRRSMYANDVPVMLAASYLPLDIAAGTQLAETDTGPGGAYSRLADLGHPLAWLTERVAVRSPDDRETAALGLDDGQRVYAIERTAEDADGRVVEVNEMTLPVHLWELVYRWPAE